MSRPGTSPLALADYDELGRVHVRVWREAYAGRMPADYLAGLSAERSADRWRATAAEAAGDGTATSTGTPEVRMVRRD